MKRHNGKRGISRNIDERRRNQSRSRAFVGAHHLFVLLLQETERPLSLLQPYTPDAYIFITDD